MAKSSRFKGFKGLETGKVFLKTKRKGHKYHNPLLKTHKNNNNVGKNRLKRLKRFANANKKRDVEAERVFRHALLKSGITYQRQRIVIIEKYNYIVDFYISWIKLVIEIDGPTHKGREEYDTFRQKQLEQQGYTVLRFTNSEVYKNVNSCVQRVWELLKLKKLCNDVAGVEVTSVSKHIRKNKDTVGEKSKREKGIEKKANRTERRIKRAERKEKGFSCKGRYGKKKNPYSKKRRQNATKIFKK